MSVVEYDSLALPVPSPLAPAVYHFVSTLRLVAANVSLQSTVLKQMKLIHHGGYNDNERESYKEIIFSNTVQSMRAILDALPSLDLSLNPSNDARRATILALPLQLEVDVMPRDVADSIKGIWNDPAVKEAVRRSREFQLNDSAVYYFNSIDRMSGPVCSRAIGSI